MNLPRWFVLFCIAFIFLLFSGCEKKPVQPVHPPTIKIGVIFPFTGHSGATGKDLKAALDLAVEIINQATDLSIPLARDVGLPAHGNALIELTYRDSESNEARAGRLVEELVAGEKVVALLGCYNSTVTAAASEQAEVLRVPFLNTTSTSPVLTQRGLKWFFRTTPDDRIFAQNFFTFFSELKQRLNIDVPKRLTLVYENRLWGTGVARVERKLAYQHGYQVVADIPYNADSDLFEYELGRIGQALPGVILQSSYADDAVQFMKGYKLRQINPAAIVAMNAGFISPSFLENLKADGEYILSREVWALDIGRKKTLVKRVNHLFMKNYGRNMNGNSARAFTGLMVLADAINRSRSLAPADIRKAILETRLTGEHLIMPWDGVSFDPATGQNVLGKGIIVQVQGGEYRTVWPWELAANPVIWPMPAWSERHFGEK